MLVTGEGHARHYPYYSSLGDPTTGIVRRSRNDVTGRPATLLLLLASEQLVLLLLSPQDFALQLQDVPHGSASLARTGERGH